VAGLFLIIIFAAWFFFARAISWFITKSISNLYLKALAKIVVFILIFACPFADEIIGRVQFREICATDAVAVYDEANVRGKTVISEPVVVNNYMNTILPIYKQTWKYQDPSTHEELISFTEVHAKGGWLSRLINFNSIHRPYTFHGLCGDQYREYFFQNLGVKDLN